MSSSLEEMKPNNLQPNQTLYCTNLPDKLNKRDLRRQVHELFSAHGIVLDVVALKTLRMRGQAHIVFRDLQTSTQAMRALQGIDFSGRELIISYAKGKSNMISKLDGTSRIPDKDQSIPGVSSALQKSIFGSVPGAQAVESKMDTTKSPPMLNGSESHGIKRVLEDSDEGDDDDEGTEMEMSDED